MAETALLMQVFHLRVLREEVLSAPMSKQADPKFIGAFVLGAIVLLLLLLGMIGSIGAIKDRQLFVMYFQSSVNNLNAGAPVKWKGVPVGQVTDIRIRWNQDALSADIPVFVEIDLSRLSMELDDPGVLRSEILNGLRAQLQLESLISGLLFIELDYLPNAARPRFVQKDPVYAEIPTVPSALSEIGEMATSIAAKLQSIDLDRIADQLVSVLENTNAILTSLDAAGLSASVRDAAIAVNKLTASPELLRAISNFANATEEIRALSARFNNDFDPLMMDVRTLAAEASQTLDQVGAAAQSLQAIISPDSELLYSVEVALTELSAAARAARDLSEFLERNPRALITGRPKTE